MDWTIFVDFSNVWYWVGFSSGLLGVLAAREVWRAQVERFGARRAIETRMSRTKAEEADTYEAMLHRNYHIGQRFGPVDGCPHCPQKAAAQAPGGTA